MSMPNHCPLTLECMILAWDMDNNEPEQENVNETSTLPS